MEEVIARGGTAGLILALVVAVMFLARFALQAYANLLADRDAWRVQAQTAVKGFEDVTRQNSDILTALTNISAAIKARNFEDRDARRSTGRKRSSG